MTGAACPAPIIGECRSVQNDRTAADSLRNISTVLTIAGVVFIAPAAFAQSGSTGGSIGKTEKSISGDQESGAPDARPQRRMERGTGSGSPSINGRWLVSQICDTGKYKIELTFQQTSPTGFTGTSVGLTTGAQSQISNGRLAGNTLTFSRDGISSDRWVAHFNGPRQFSGTSSGSLWHCSYTAVRQ